jgi:sulfatase modifying factor 1
MTRLRLPLASLFVLSLAGCGEGPPPPPPPVVAPPPMVTTVPATAGGAPAAPTGSKASPADSRPKSKIDSSIPDDKVFLVNAEENNFNVADPQVNPADQFSVAPPQSLREVAVVGAPAAGTISAKLPEGFTAIATAGATSDGWPNRIQCTADGSEMAYIPSGIFRQGVDGGSPEAGPSHPVYLDAYYIDVREVTLEQFFKARAALKESEKGNLVEPANASAAQNLPALGVMWRDAVAYAKWAKKELPTEAQWEMAARGPKSFTYPWGEDRVLWGRKRSLGQIDPVGSFRTDVSGFGLMDVSGNAREWCSDFFSPDYYAGAKERDGSPIRNPQGPRSSPNLSRVAKGGKNGWELWHRSGDSMQKSAPDLGFRCVLRLTPAEAETKPSA